MSLSFVMPMLLPLLALAAGPVVIHILARRRPPRADFPTLRFLMPLQLQMQRANRPRDLLLLLLRTLFILCLTAAFARPLLFEAGVGQEEAGKRHVVILLDRSLSMQATTGGVTRFRVACSKANEILRGLRPGDRANLIFVDHEPEAVFPALSGNLAALKQEITAARSGFGRDRFAPALQLAAKQLLGESDEQESTSRELYLISDFQQNRWQEEALPPLPPQTRVLYVECGGKKEATPSNITINRIVVKPGQPIVGESVQILVELTNHGDTLFYSRDVSLDAGGQLKSGEIRLQPRSQGTILYTLRFTRTGDIPLCVRLGNDESDPLPADNEAFGLLRVRPSIPVRLVKTDAWTASYLHAALAPRGEGRDPATVEPVASPQVEEDTTLLVLAGYNGALSPAVTDWVRTGGTLLWTLPETPDEALRLPGQWQVEGAIKDYPAALYPTVANPDDPLLQVFERGASGDLSKAAFAKGHALHGGEGEVVLRLGDAPALVRLPMGAGTIWLWNLSLRHSNFVKRATFLPLVQELLAESRRPTPAAHTLVGDPLAARLRLPVNPSDISLLAPDGTALDFDVSIGERELTVRYPASAMPGGYEVRLHDKTARYLAVTVDPTEGDLTPAQSLPELGGQSIALSGETSLAGVTQGRELWPTLMIFGFLFLACEAVLLGFWKQRRAASTPEGSV